MCKFKIGDKVITYGDYSPAVVIGIKNNLKEVYADKENKDATELLKAYEDELTKKEKRSPFYLLEFEHQPNNYWNESELRFAN